MKRIGCLIVSLLCLMVSCNKDDEITLESTDGRRLGTASSKAECSKVYEYLPAPGQFINENCNAVTMDEACRWALQRLQQKQFVSLGAFGGSITVGFDHSIVNTGGYDFAVTGNALTNGSEPGVVWVMQDSNGNGLPDDTWYELAGSETGRTGTVQQYAVTYTRPAGDRQPVPWTDNRDGNGIIAHLPTYHNQPSYYPAWVKESSYTLTGTRLEARNYDASGNGSEWVLPACAYGYADNASTTDRILSGKNANCFRISDAVDLHLQPVPLPYIDFVKVQTALQSASGWLGECSTEVLDIFDCNL